MEDKMNKLRRLKTKIRYWLIGKIFNDDEKYLMILAVEDRINNLERISVNERWANKENIHIDIIDYMRMRDIFSTRDYK